jgi:hypothetical protein
MNPRNPVPAPPAADPPVRVDDDTLRIVAERIAARARDYGFGAGAPGSVNLRPFDAASSFPLYLAEIGADTARPHKVVVKFAPIYGQHREGYAEFANLRTMAARLGPSQYLHVPQPLDYWEDVNALVTEHRPGSRFSERILAAPPWFMAWRVRSSLMRTSRQCGEWLRIYHEATAREDGPAIDDHFLARMRRDIDRIPVRGPFAGLRSHVEAALAVMREALADRRVPVAIRHGDYSPDNIHLDGDGICVFDLSHHSPAPVHDDITFFLVTLDTINPYPRYLAFDRRVARALAGPFLDGYYGDHRAAREREDDPVLGAYMLKNLLARCLRQRRVAAAAGPLALAAFDGFWVVGRYRDLFNRAIERVAGRR